MTEWAGASRQVAQIYPDRRRVLRWHDALSRLDRITEESTGASIADYAWAGPSRLARLTYGNNLSLDRRNAERTGTVGGTLPGYDANARVVRQPWNCWTRGAARSATRVSTGDFGGPLKDRGSEGEPREGHAPPLHAPAQETEDRRAGPGRGMLLPNGSGARDGRAERPAGVPTCVRPVRARRREPCRGHRPCRGRSPRWPARGPGT